MRDNIGRGTLSQLALVVSMVAAGVVLAAEPAPALMAGTGGRSANCAVNDPGEVIATDNYQHTVFRSALSSGMNTAAVWALDNQYNTLDMDVIYAASVNSTTDAVLYDQNYSTYCGINWNSASGLSSCVARNAVRECEKNEVRWDNSTVDGWNVSQRRFIACHEIGHSVGLVHNGAGTCMNGDVVDQEGLSFGDADSVNWWFDPDTACCEKLLNGNQALTSSSGNYRLVMQSDGNLVGVNRDNSNNNNFGSFWSTATNGRDGANAVMQGDGNLVVYHPSCSDGVCWASGTGGRNGANLVMQSDRNVVIYHSTCPSSVCWASWTQI